MQSLILAKLTFRPTPAECRRKFQASELIISVIIIYYMHKQRISSEVKLPTRLHQNSYFKKTYNAIKVSLALRLLS